MKKIQSSDVGSIVDKLSIETLMGLPDSCIYALRHSSKKRIQVFSTTCMVAHLGKLLEEIKVGSGEWSTLKEDIQEIDLVILETFSDPKERKIKHSSWISLYGGLGYEFYRNITPVRYRVDVQMGYRMNRLHYFVRLVNTRKEGILIGVYTRKKDMNAFLDLHYPGGLVSQIVIDEESIRNEK